MTRFARKGTLILADARSLRRFYAHCVRNGCRSAVAVSYGIGPSFNISQVLMSSLRSERYLLYSLTLASLSIRVSGIVGPWYILMDRWSILYTR